MPDLYKRVNEQTFDFIPPLLTQLNAEMSQMYPQGWEVWDKYRQIDGVTEYIAEDIIMAQIYQHLKVRGVRYFMYEEGGSMPVEHVELVWELDTKQRSRVIPNINFRHHLPKPLYGFDAVNVLLDLSECLDSLRRTQNHSEHLWAIWTAEVNGAVAYGNGPGEAIAHAWGISKGIWQPDPLNIGQKPRPFTLDEDTLDGDAPLG